MVLTSLFNLYLSVKIPHLAQLVERLAVIQSRYQNVDGSIPSVGINDVFIDYQSHPIQFECEYVNLCCQLHKQRLNIENVLQRK